MGESLARKNGAKEVEVIRRSQLVWISVGLGLLAQIGGLGATLHVPGTYATIQAAISAANAGDTIEVPPFYVPPAVRVRVFPPATLGLP